MNKIFALCFCFFCPILFAGEEEDFILAWESIQSGHSEVESFEKIEDRKYKVKFKTLPFEGELIVLAYDVEDVDFVMEGSPFSKSGYVEIDLVGFSDESMSKYSRSYYKWAQDNELHFDSINNQWVTSKEYRLALSNSVNTDDALPSKFFLILIEYWNYVLVGIILYFFFSQISNSKRAKESVQYQQKAIDDMANTKLLMQQSLDMHKETNRLLESIHNQLKR